MTELGQKADGLRLWKCAKQHVDSLWQMELMMDTRTGLRRSRYAIPGLSEDPIYSLDMTQEVVCMREELPDMKPSALCEFLSSMFPDERASSEKGNWTLGMQCLIEPLQKIRKMARASCLISIVLRWMWTWDEGVVPEIYFSSFFTVQNM